MRWGARTFCSVVLRTEFGFRGSDLRFRALYPQLPDQILDVVTHPTLLDRQCPGCRLIPILYIPEEVEADHCPSRRYERALLTVVLIEPRHCRSSLNSRGRVSLWGVAKPALQNRLVVVGVRGKSAHLRFDR